MLKAAVVGCGRIASTFDKDPKRRYVATHAGAYQAVPGISLTAACDLDEKRLAEFGERWGIKRLYTDFSTLLREMKPDVVSICTWPGSHYALARQAVRAGVKAIFCEKPVTDSLADADALIRLCRQKKVVLAVNHSRRWDDTHHRVKSFLDHGIGTVRHAHAFYTAGISNTGTHLLDMLRYFLGDATWVQASPKPVFGDKDPTLSAQILFKSGVLVTLSGLDVNDYLIFEMDFYGSSGRLRITHSGFGVETWKSGPSSFFSGYKELLPASGLVRPAPKRMMVNAVKDIVRAVRDKKDPLSTGVDGLKALELICALKKSLKEGGSRISLPLKNRKVKL